MSNVFENIEKARKKIHDVTEISPDCMDSTHQTFTEMDIDAKKDGEHIGGDWYRVKIKGTAADA